MAIMAIIMAELSKHILTFFETGRKSAQGKFILDHSCKKKKINK